MATPAAPSLHPATGWSALPADLLRCILNLLGYSMLDVSAFCGVCRNWREIVQDFLPSFPPLLAIERRGVANGDGVRDAALYDISSRRFLRVRLPPRQGNCYITPSHGFALKTYTDDMKPVVLYNVVTGEEILLPCIGEIAGKVHYNRAVLSSPPSLPGCSVALIGLRSFLFCKVGDSQWLPGSCNGMYISDMLFFQGALYAALQGELAVIDVLPDRVESRHITAISLMLMPTLAELRGELVLLSGSRVFTLDGEEWRRKVDLGGAAVFCTNYKFTQAFVPAVVGEGTPWRRDTVYEVVDYGRGWKELPVVGYVGGPSADVALEGGSWCRCWVSATALIHAAKI